MEDRVDEVISPPPPEPQERHGASGPAPVVVPRPHSHAWIVVVAILASLVIGGLSGAAGSFILYRALPSAGGGGKAQQVEIIAGKTEEVVAAAAAAAVPSVVNIAVTGGGGTSSESLPDEHPDVPLEGEGSGVAYRAADGGTYIITNNHVIDGATEITVTDSAGESYDAELVGGDSESDIAVVLVEAEIPVIEIGDPERVIVGQLAIAIGSPYGLEASVTSGVISATHRALTDMTGGDGQYPYVDAIQTDAAINSGNSGGALVNRAGELIGIPSVIYTDTGSSAGIGFAIPVNRATQAADELIEKGRVDTPFLGVLGQTLTPAAAQELGLPIKQGALVVEITEGTEAEKAGLRADDVIVGIDDDRIRTMDDLILYVRRHSVGDTVTVKLWRDGEEISVEMTVGIKPAENRAE